MSFSLLMTTPAVAPVTDSCLNQQSKWKSPALKFYEVKTSHTSFSLRQGRRRWWRLCCRAQLAEIAPATSAAFGVLLLGGGVFAYTKSGSKGSLFGGLTGGALMLAVYFLIQDPETKAIGDALGFGSAFLFSSVFGIRLAATRKLTPAGPLLGLSICALVVFISAYLQDTV